MRVLHARSNYLDRRVAQRRSYPIRGGDPRMDERQHLSVRCLSEHRRGDSTHGRGRDTMKPFTYTRPHHIGAAVAEMEAEPGAAFIAGATEMTNWMRDGIQSPTRLVDINALPLTGIEVGEDRLRVGALARM